MRTLIAACLLALPLLVGCRTGSQAYVDENSGGNFIVKGKVSSIEALTSSKWEALSDGYVFSVEPPGCKVTLSQETAAGTSKSTQFDLVAGDSIIIGDDFDFILSSLDQKKGPTGNPVPPVGDSE